MSDSSPQARCLLPALFFIVAVLLSGPAYPQTETASIRGVVTDPTGAVVQDATVRLVAVERGPQVEIRSAKGGVYGKGH